jgi:hypothetical protein
LPDDVTVYPAHGAGSACGKNMSKETVSTIGNQKETILRADMTEEEFIKSDRWFIPSCLWNECGYE